MENKDFLIKKLKLTNLLVKNDKGAVELAKEFKDLTEEQKQGVSELINGFVDDTSDTALIKEVINTIDFGDKDYLLSIIDLKQLNYFRDSTNFEKVIREKLESGKDFKDEIKNYMYYSLIVNLVIGSKKPELIELAIDKIQSI